MIKLYGFTVPAAVSFINFRKAANSFATKSGQFGVLTTAVEGKAT
jgi:hypothetical protein